MNSARSGCLYPFCLSTHSPHYRCSLLFLYLKAWAVTGVSAVLSAAYFSPIYQRQAFSSLSYCCRAFKYVSLPAFVRPCYHVRDPPPPCHRLVFLASSPVCLLCFLSVWVFSPHHQCLDSIGELSSCCRQPLIN